MAANEGKKTPCENMKNTHLGFSFFAKYKK